MTSKCSMDGCEEETDSGLFKIDENKAYIIPLCTRHLHELIIKRSVTDKKILMVIDRKKLPSIVILNN